MTAAKSVRIELSTYERDLILKHVSLCCPGLEEKIRNKRSRNGCVGIDVSSDELEDLLGCVAREANHTPNRNLEDDLDGIFTSLESSQFMLRRQQFNQGL